MYFIKKENIVLNWRPITSPTGHQLLLISKLSIGPLSQQTRSITNWSIIDCIVPLRVCISHMHCISKHSSIRKLDLSHLCFSLNFYFLMFFRLFPSMFPLLTYFQSLFSLSADHLRHSRRRRSKSSILLIQETV